MLLKLTLKVLVMSRLTWCRKISTRRRSFPRLLVTDAAPATPDDDSVRRPARRIMCPPTAASNLTTAHPHRPRSARMTQSRHPPRSRANSRVEETGGCCGCYCFTAAVAAALGMPPAVVRYGHRGGRGLKQYCTKLCP